MLQHLGSYLNPNSVSFKWPWAEMLCCLIDGVISFQHYHFLCLLSCLMLCEHSQAVKYFVYWQDKYSGSNIPALLHCSRREKRPSPAGHQQKGMGQAPTGTTQSQRDAVLRGWDLPPTQGGDWRYLSQVTGLLCHRPLIIREEMELVRFTGPFW